jgi:hypothetical protein
MWVPCLRLRIRFAQEKISASLFHTCHTRRASRNKRFLAIFRTAIAIPALYSVRSRHRMKALQHTPAEALPRLEYTVCSDALVDLIVISEIRFWRDIFAHLSTSVLLFSSMPLHLIKCHARILDSSSCCAPCFGEKSGAKGLILLVLTWIRNLSGN